MCTILTTSRQGLGVPYSTFQKFQDIAVEEAQESAESLGKAARLLETYGLGTSYRLTSVMLSLDKLGIDNLDDDFYRKSLEFAIHHVLRELKQHSRIPVPGGWTLVGVADVHGYLKEGEIFACFKSQDTGTTIYLEGPTLISRSPTIHPGDVSRSHCNILCLMSDYSCRSLGSSCPCHRKTTSRFMFRERETSLHRCI